MPFAVAGRLRGGGEPVGTFEVRGISGPVSVLRPAREAAAA